jgi:DNA-binding NarL/FixJ family response regulator
VVRSGLGDFIARDNRFDVLGTVSHAHAFIDLCATQPVEIGVVGWSLPDMNGGEVLQIVKRRQLGTRIIIYTGETAPDILRTAVQGGAWGFVSKSDEPNVLLDTISTVSRGRLCLPYIDMESFGKDPLEILTSREKELLGALTNGWTNLQIAARFGISRNTVKYHLKNLYDKLGVHNRAMAVALYLSKSGNSS